MKHRHAVLALLCALGVILYLDRICISVALPRIQAELHIAPERLGWVSVVFSLGYAIFEIPSGHLGDRRGTRSVLTRIVVAWSLFTALTGAATGLWPLLATRFLFGAGEAGAFPNAASAIARWFPARARARALGIFGAATSVGGIASPLLVIPIQSRFGWRASFVAFAILGVLWAVGWYAWFRDDPRDKPGVRAEELAELRELPRPASHGLPWRAAVRQRNVWGLVGTFFCAIYVAFFAVFWAPTFLVKARGFTEGELRWTAILWVGAGLGCALGGVASDALVARLGLRWGRRIGGCTALAVAAGGCAILATTTDKPTTIAALTVVMAALGAHQTTSLAVCLDVGRAHRGALVGAMNTAGQLGGAVSAGAFGYLVKASGRYDVPVFVMGAIAALGAAGWLAIDASRPLPTKD